MEAIFNTCFIPLLREEMQPNGGTEGIFVVRRLAPAFCISFFTYLCLVAAPCAQYRCLDTLRDCRGRTQHFWSQFVPWRMRTADACLVTHSTERSSQLPASFSPWTETSLLASHFTWAFPKPFRGWNHANVDSSPRPHPLCYRVQPRENGRWACRRRWKMARNGCLGTSSLVTWLRYPFFTLRRLTPLSPSPSPSLPLQPPLILSEMVCASSNLHNTLLTPLLQSSITAPSLSLSFVWACLFFIRPCTKD